MFLLEAFKSTYFFQQVCVHLHIRPWEKNKYAGKKQLDISASNNFIKAKIISDNPFFITRLGATECELLRQRIFIKRLLRFKYSKKITNDALILSGIFPNTRKFLNEFCDFYLSIIKEADGFGVWNRPFEKYILNKYCGNNFTALDFYALYPGINDWTSCLKNKKVLVIHPFAETITKQYKKRKKLFDNPNLLPNFELIAYKSVVTFAGSSDNRFDNWFDALNHMFLDIKKIDFEICLIGCGAYGLALGGLIYKNLNKKVIHVGGSLQLLFGIDGNLYHNYSLTKDLINPFWVYPSDSETPKEAFKVENSMYWKKL